MRYVTYTPTQAPAPPPRTGVLLDGDRVAPLNPAALPVGAATLRTLIAAWTRQ
ncbi:hypothetical protein [Streptomyces sp. NPDC057580]|uniref:hypothetical protein n=1 Tax=Streptomyces sp. NPDC057580 TaxID=3346173 RepID=UPI0036832F37